MFRFENSEYLYLLIALVPLLIWMIYAEKSRRKQRNKLIEKKLFNKIVPEFNPRSHWLRNILISLTFVFAILALANPQWANKREKVKVQSSDIFIALDISRSMLGQDISPNRLERSKKTIEKLIDKLKGNRIGLIFFAGDAFMKMPLTTDYAAAKLFVKSADPDLIENQGTAIEEAINIAEKGFDEKEKHQRAMVIISDGEDHDGDAINKAKEAHKNGLVIFAIGVGTSKGAFIPYKNRYGVEQYKKDENGNYIKSKLNEELLNEIADVGGGKYYSILEGDKIIENIAGQLEKIEKREVEQRSFTHYDSFFQYFLFLAILALILTFIITDSKLRMNGIKKTLTIMIFLFVAFNLSAQSGHKLRLDADKLYTKEKYEDAEIKYKKALEKENEYKGNFNLGNTLYKENRYEESAEAYEKALKETGDSLIRSKIYHNLGNSYFQQKKYDKSLENYKQALRLNPVDQNTRKNLAIVKQIIKQQQKQKQKQKQQQKQKNNKNNKDQKDQQNKDKQQNNKDKQNQNNKDKQNQNKENKDKQNENKQDSLKNNQDQQQQMGQDSTQNMPDSLKMTKEELIKLLKAIENDDKEIQKRIRKRGQSKKRDKDW